MIWKKLINVWIPEKKDDEISGKLLRVDSDVGDHKSMLYTLETEDSIRGVWGCAVLDDKMDLFQLGNNIKIIFLGKKKGGKSEEYKDFDVFLGVQDEIPIEDLE